MLKRIFRAAAALLLAFVALPVLGGCAGRVGYTVIAALSDLPKELQAPAEAIGQQRGYAVLTAADGSRWLLINAGQKPSSGYGLTVKSVRSKGDVVTVTVGEKSPEPGAMVLTMLTFPRAIVAITDAPTGASFAVVTEGGEALSELKPGGWRAPQVPLVVDLAIVTNSQRSVDAGHSPWQLDATMVVTVYLTTQVNVPKATIGQLSETYNDGARAIYTAAGGPIARVYIERLVRQDATGIWTVVGYDLR